MVELAIRDLKDQALAHFPSGRFLANAAWTVIAALAHNLLRWTTLIGLPDTVIPTARTVRRRLLTVPGRITRTARTVTLRMPARWPWELAFLAALKRLRALPALHLTATRAAHGHARRLTPASACPEHRDLPPLPPSRGPGALASPRIHAHATPASSSQPLRRPNYDAPVQTVDRG